MNMEIFNNMNFENEGRRVLMQHPFVILSDRSFIGTYRLSKILVQELTNLPTPFIKGPNTFAGLFRKKTLRFFASGSYQQDIGEHRGASVSQASVSRCITEVANALNVPEILNKYIHFPNSVSELKEVNLGFYEKFGIPGVIGVIDGTRIDIVPPNRDDLIYPELYKMLYTMFNKDLRFKPENFKCMCKVSGKFS
ncbi:hypothetical protein QTP88_024107 [Uroleucon formosanum]